MGINDNYFRFQQLHRNTTHSLSIVQHNTTPLIQGNKILIIIHKPLNSGRIKLFSGNTNNNHHIFVGIPNTKCEHKRNRQQRKRHRYQQYWYHQQLYQY